MFGENLQIFNTSTVMMKLYIDDLLKIQFNQLMFMLFVES